ncbi:MAG: ABC transporter permease, partial [Promethearchaeota archaeon]
MQMMMVFVSILSMMISAILINSILTTSIEERIREFGILRVLGSKRRDNVLIVLNQGIFMGLFGTAIGVIGAILAVPWLLDLLYSLVSWFSNPIPTIFLPQTIINTIIIGLASSIIISIWPALKASNLNIAQAIDPYRRKEEGWTLKKEGSANTRTIIMGIAISSVGLIIFILFPRIIVTQNFGLITSLFIALLLAVLIGLVFALLGIIPVLQWLILQVFKPFIRKYSPIVKLSLKRNRRRNTGNSLMFSLTFSFIFFNSSFLAIRHQMIADNLQFQYGADIVIINQGSPQAGTAIDLDFYSKLSKLQGIKSMAPIAHNTIDAAELLSLISSAQEQSMDIESLMPMFMNVFTNNKTKTYIGSVSAFKLVECGFIGINRSYVDMSNKNYFMWDRASGSNTRDSFNALFDNSTNNTIIISKAIADYIGVTKLGQKVRIVFAEKGQNQYDGYAQTMTVVGITGGMPGFWNFRSSKFSANGGGVMISLDNYLKWMKQGSIDNISTPIDKILVNLQNTDKNSIADIKSLINDLYGEKYDFIIDDNISKIGLFNQGDQTIDLIMQIILTLTIIIALFGLLSTIYSSLLERMFEVGLLRAMGLRSSNVRGIFIAESLISMLAAGTLGMLIGVFIAYMLVSNAGMITEMPTPFTIEVGTLIRTYLISITISVIGVIFITRKIKKWSIMDIFRQTF